MSSPPTIPCGKQHSLVPHKEQGYGDRPQAVLRQHTETGGEHGAQRRFAVGRGIVAGQLVLAIAEEREVVDGEPAQQLRAVARLVLRQLRRVADQLVGELAGGRGHLVDVLDDLADVVEHRVQPGLLITGPVRVRDQVDLDVHPRLGDDLSQRRGRVRERQDLAQGTRSRRTTTTGWACPIKDHGQTTVNRSSQTGPPLLCHSCSRHHQRPTEINSNNL